MTKRYKTKEKTSLLFPPLAFSQHKIHLKSCINLKFALNSFPRSPITKDNNQRFVLLSVATSHLTRLKWTVQELFKASQFICL